MKRGNNDNSDKNIKHFDDAMSDIETNIKLLNEQFRQVASILNAVSDHQHKTLDALHKRIVYWNDMQRERRAIYETSSDINDEMVAETANIVKRELENIERLLKGETPKPWQ